MCHTVILIGRVENSATKSMDSGASNDVHHNVLQAATDVVINRHYHSIAAYHSTTHDITLLQSNGPLLNKFKNGRQFLQEMATYHSGESHENYGQNQPAAAKGRPKIEIVSEEFKADGQIEEK